MTAVFKKENSFQLKYLPYSNCGARLEKRRESSLMDGLLFVGHWADYIIGWRKEKIRPSNRWPYICRAPCSLCVLPFHIMFPHIIKFLLTDC